MYFLFISWINKRHSWIILVTNWIILQFRYLLVFKGLSWFETQRGFYAKLCSRFIILVLHLFTYNNMASGGVTSVYTFISELSSYNLINLWWRYISYTNTCRRWDDLRRKTNINVYHCHVKRNKLCFLHLGADSLLSFWKHHFFTSSDWYYEELNFIYIYFLSSFKFILNNHN